MSTKYFDWAGGVPGVVATEKYPEGAPVEFVILRAPRAAIQGWHALSQSQRAAIVARMSVAGWTEAGQSKPD